MPRQPLLLEGAPCHGVAELLPRDLVVRKAESEIKAALELLQVLLRQAPGTPQHRAANRGHHLEHDAPTGPPVAVLPAAVSAAARLQGEVGGGGDGRHFLLCLFTASIGSILANGSGVCRASGLLGFWLICRLPSPGSCTVLLEHESARNKRNC